MTVSSVASAPPALAEAREPKGPDVRNDHDGDDAAAKAPVQAAAPQGQGVKLDTTA